MTSTFHDAVAHGFRHVLDFRGRDSRGLFWPYAGAILVSWFVLSNAILIPVLLIQASVGTGDPREMTGVILGVTAVAALVMLGMLASATTRRLHDRGLRGVWAAIPVGLAATGLAIFATLTSSADEPDLTLFVAGVVNNLLYFATLIALIMQLVLGGKPEGSRFEPA